MLICTTLPSLRKFFRHISPHLIGERSSKNQSEGYSGSTNPIHTIGGSGGLPKSGVKRSKYSRFDDTQYGMETTVNVEMDKMDQRKSHNPNWEAGSGDDDESQKGIVQTRTTTITYHNHKPRP